MTKLKICGLTRLQDIEAVNEAGPDYIGFVFAQSRRQVSREQALKLRRRLKSGIKAVGVFKDAPAEEIKEICRQGILDLIQLHGREDSACITRLRQHTGLPVIKTISMRPGLEAGTLDEIPADFLLLDQGKGGTGTCFDWSLIPKIKKPFFLAGGLNPGNLGQALRQVKPFGVDLSSGAETDGVKDREKIFQAVQIVKYETRRNS